MKRLERTRTERMLTLPEQAARGGGSRSSHIHQQGEASDSLHGEDEEGDHGQVPAILVGLDPGQHLLKRWVCGSGETEGARMQWDILHFK